MRDETVTTRRTEDAEQRDPRRWTIRAHHAFDNVVTVERGFDSLEWGERVEVVPASQLQGAVDRMVLLEMALDMAADDAQRFTVQEYVEMAGRKLAAVYEER